MFRLHSFKLITVVVPDEHDKLFVSLCTGQPPVGWCIADNESNEVIELLLRSKKTRSPETFVGVIMTDDGRL